MIGGLSDGVEDMVKKAEARVLVDLHNQGGRGCWLRNMGL